MWRGITSAAGIRLSGWLALVTASLIASAVLQVAADDKVKRIIAPGDADVAPQVFAEEIQRQKVPLEQQVGGMTAIVAPPQFLQGAPPFAGPVDTSKWAPGLDLKSLTTGGPTDVPGFGKIERDELLMSLWSLNPQMSRVRLVDIQGRSLLGNQKFPVPARVLYHMPDQNSVLVDSQGCFAAFSQQAVEMNGSLLLLIQTATGQKFDAFIKPIPNQIIDVRLSTHLNPKVAAPQKVDKDELAGVVVDSDGQPIEGVTVDCFENSLPTARTDAKGQFRIADVRKQLKSLSAESSGVPLSFRKPGYELTVSMEFALGVPGCVVAMENRTWVEGIVRGSDGKPVPGALVRSYQFHRLEGAAFAEQEWRLPGMWQEVTTDLAGQYRIPSRPGKCELFVRKTGSGIAHPVAKPLCHGEHRQLDIALQPGAILDATLVDSVTKKPVSNVRLLSRLFPDLDARSDRQGKIKIIDVIPDRYEFDVDAKEHHRWWLDSVVPTLPKLHEYDEDQALWSATISELKIDLRNEAKALTVMLEQSVRVQGRIVDPDGKPVPNAVIRVVNASNGSWLSTVCRTSESRVLETTAGLDGKFEMPLATSGPLRFRLIADEFKESQPNQRWATGLSPAFALKPGQSFEPMEIKLNRPITLKGKLVDAKGKVLPNCQVKITSADHVIGSSRYGYDGLRIEANAEGVFEAKLLRPAFYEVEVWPRHDLGSPTKQKLSLSAKEPVKQFEMRMDPPNANGMAHEVREVVTPPVRILPAE